MHFTEVSWLLLTWWFLSKLTASGPVLKNALKKTCSDFKSRTYPLHLFLNLHFNTDTHVKMSAPAINALSDLWCVIARMRFYFFSIPGPPPPFFVPVNNRFDPSVFPLNLNVIRKSSQLYLSEWYSSFIIQCPSASATPGLNMFEARAPAFFGISK